MYFSHFDMRIDWEKESDREVFELTRTVRITCMKRIRIWNFKEEQNKDLLDYLTHIWPYQLREFNFDADTEYGVYGWANYYLDGIAKVGKEYILYV